MVFSELTRSRKIFLAGGFSELTRSQLTNKYSLLVVFWDPLGSVFCGFPRAVPSRFRQCGLGSLGLLQLAVRAAINQPSASSFSSDKAACPKMECYLPGGLQSVATWAK